MLERACFSLSVAFGQSLTRLPPTEVSSSAFSFVVSSPFFGWPALFWGAYHLNDEEEITHWILKFTDVEGCNVEWCSLLFHTFSQHPSFWERARKRRVLHLYVPHSKRRRARPVLLLEAIGRARTPAEMWKWGCRNVKNRWKMEPSWRFGKRACRERWGHNEPQEWWRESVFCPPAPLSDPSEFQYTASIISMPSLIIT